MKNIFFFILFGISNLVLASFDCSTPTVVAEGSHYTYNGNGDKYYVYRNSTVNDLFVEISSCGATTNTFVRIFSDCSNQIGSATFGCGVQAEIETVVEAGDSLIIMWDDINTISGFDWTLSSSVMKPGDLCSHPIPLQEGLNYSQKEDVQQWYEITNNTSDLQIVTVTGDNDEYVYNKPACTGSSDKHAKNTITFQLDPGESNYVVWNAIDEFTVEIRGEEKGDLCTDPIQANLGINEAVNIGGDQWFVYTNPYNEKLLYQLNGGFFSYVQVYYDDCDGSPKYYGSESIYADIEAGQTVYIKWEDPEETWELVLTTGPEGSCQNPKMAEIGTNTNSNPGY